MRIQVQIGGECVGLNEAPRETLRHLAESACAKLYKLRPSLFDGVFGDNHSQQANEDSNSSAKSFGPSQQHGVPSKGKKPDGIQWSSYVREIRRTVGGALLDPDDKLVDAFKEGEFCIVVLKSELAENKQHPIVHNRQAKVVHTPEDSLFHVYKDPKYFIAPTEILELDGESLDTAELVRCGRGLYRIKLTEEAEKKITASRNMLEEIVAENKVVYGITTGFGNFARVCIPSDKLVARMLLALRINVLAKGYAGISLKIVKTMIEAFNAFCVSWVPEKGTVGCSGDLAPLSHLALGLMGEGQMWSPQTGWDEAAKVLSAHGIRPIELGPKEGIALINGTQMVSALAAEAIERADAVARQADVIAALTLDVLKGTTKAFDPDIHRLRPHEGQIQTAERLRALLHSDKNPSHIAESHRFCDRVQDAYTLRCVPQVHGVVHDTIKFVRKVLNTELNSATDNPLVFAERGEILSGGNFHGEYPAKMMDYLAIGVHELASISERRLERMVNSKYSGLPDFLTAEGGLNSGFMMVQVCAASLVSENKVLCHPSSVDSIPTSGNQEDHVSMGGFASRKALRVVEHVEQVLAMELLAACQGMEFLKPLQSTSPLHAVYKLVRSVSPAIKRDRFFAPEMEKVIRLIQDGKIWETVKPHLDSIHAQENDNPAWLWTPVHSPTQSTARRSTTPDISQPPPISEPVRKRSRASKS